MAKDGFKRFSPSVSRPKPVHSIYRFHFHTGNFFQATKKFISPWTLVFVFFLSFSPAHGTQSHIQGSHEQFDTLYVKGKNLFYEILRREAQNMQLVNKEKELLLKAQKKTPGLYEHLMNFYYFHKRPKQEKGVNFQSHLLNFSRNMAEEFIESIIEFPSNKKYPPLESVLHSTGYFSRQMFPIYREYRRPISKLVRTQWPIDELKIKEAHSLSKGKGIKLAIIDTGVDPTLKEIRSKIVKWKNFLDGSKPIFDKGKCSNIISCNIRK